MVVFIVSQQSIRDFGHHNFFEFEVFFLNGRILFLKCYINPPIRWRVYNEFLKYIYYGFFLKNKKPKKSDFNKKNFGEPTTVIKKLKIKHPSDTKIYMIRLSATNPT